MSPLALPVARLSARHSCSASVEVGQKLKNINRKIHCRHSIKKIMTLSYFFFSTIGLNEKIKFILEIIINIYFKINFELAKNYLQTNFHTF